MPFNSQTSQKIPAAAYIGWQTEYQREYIWKQQSSILNNTTNGVFVRNSQQPNRNYETKKDIIRPKSESNHNRESHSEYRNDERKYKTIESQYRDSCRQSADDYEYDAHYNFANRDNFSDGSPLEQNQKNRQAVFSLENSKQQSKYFERDCSVVVSPRVRSYDQEPEISRTTRNHRQALQHQRQLKNSPNIVAYGNGNTNPTSDENFMKTFNVNAPQSQVYPNTEEKNARISEYEELRLRLVQQQPLQRKAAQYSIPTVAARHQILQQQQQQQQQQYQQQQNQEHKEKEESPFAKYFNASANVLKAGNTYQTEYQREYNRSGVGETGRPPPVNILRATALPPQPPLHFRAEEKTVTNCSTNATQDSHSEKEQKKEEKEVKEGREEEEEREDEVSSTATPMINSSSPAKFHILKDGFPANLYADYNENQPEVVVERHVTESGRVLRFYPDPPSTWNLAQSLLHRARQRVAVNQ